MICLTSVGFCFGAYIQLGSTSATFLIPNIADVLKNEMVRLLPASSRGRADDLHLPSQGNYNIVFVILLVCLLIPAVGLYWKSPTPLGPFLSIDEEK